ncbi:MAG: SoxR reducing system RseC family protein [Dechloromonas sp.]|uniref:SoxR reducing system RseC family protein n=1 Tax=Candidatus Dechloromonas phosphorivorans TaxID=2899244 RepID=A0A935K9V4_9RHOO|nr:SoxR reducing system RseC family protein [Candidatus Dechloromonas phosphorivorans]
MAAPTAGDMVMIGLPASRLTFSALLGYLFPAFAMIFGAWLGSLSDGSDGATALGAMAGFLGALAIARIAIGLVPDLMPAPRLITSSPHSNLSQQEFHHERYSNH